MTSYLAHEQHSQGLNPATWIQSWLLDTVLHSSFSCLIFSHAAQSSSSLVCHTWTPLVGPTKSARLLSPLASLLPILPETAARPKLCFYQLK